MNESLSDFYIAYKLLKDIGTKWTDFKAYELGLIDEKGKRLKSPKTKEEKEAYDSYYKIIFNIKRLMSKFITQNQNLQRAISLFLLKENYIEPQINVFLNKLLESYTILKESEDKVLSDSEIELILKTL